MGDAAACANAGQRLPKGYYNMVMMLQMVSRSGGEFRWCRLDVCMGVADDGKSVNPKRHKGSQRRPRLESNLKARFVPCDLVAGGLAHPVRRRAFSLMTQFLSVWVNPIPNSRVT